jgi:hypothetical protein
MRYVQTMCVAASRIRYAISSQSHDDTGLHNRQIVTDAVCNMVLLDGCESEGLMGESRDMK